MTVRVDLWNDVWVVSKRTRRTVSTVGDTVYTSAFGRTPDHEAPPAPGSDAPSAIVDAENPLPPDPRSFVLDLSEDEVPHDSSSG